MSTRQSERYKTGGNAKNDMKNTGSLGSVFEGQKSLFRRLEDSLKTRISNEVGREALEYLFTDWPEDPASTPENPIYNVSREFLPMKTPALIENDLEVQATTAQGVLRVNPDGSKLMRPITVDDKDRNRKSVQAISTYNTKIHATITGCNRILSEHCGDAINLKFNEYSGDPIKCWNYLKKQFGPTSCGHTDISTECMNILNMKMGVDERVQNFMVRFDLARTYTKTNDNMARALLLSDGSSDRKIQMLPDRLMTAVTKCIQDNKAYAECVAYITHQDSVAHDSGRLPPNKDGHKSVRAVQELKAPAEDTLLKGNCFNCGNKGHVSSTCSTPACGFCEVFHCGHRSDTCPVRTQRGKRGSDKTRPSQPQANKQKGTFKKGSSPTSKKPRLGKRPGLKVKKVRAAAGPSAEDNSDDYDEDGDGSNEDAEERNAFAVWTRAVRNVTSSPILSEEDVASSDEDAHASLKNIDGLNPRSQSPFPSHQSFFESVSTSKGQMSQIRRRTSPRIFMLRRINRNQKLRHVLSMEKAEGIIDSGSEEH